MNITLETLESMGACKLAKEWFAAKFDFDDAAVYELFVWDVLAKDESVGVGERGRWLAWWIMKRCKNNGKAYGWRHFVSWVSSYDKNPNVVYDWRKSLLVQISGERR